MLATPFFKTWWVVEGRLLAGQYPGSPSSSETREKLGRLLDAGVRAFVNLQEPDEKGAGGQEFPDYVPDLWTLAKSRGLSIQTVRVPIRDWDVTSIERVAFALDVIDASLARGMPVYLHCWGGRGRSGTVVGCWLRRHGASADEALRRLRELREGHVDPEKVDAPETASQRAMVRDWREPARASSALASPAAHRPPAEPPKPASRQERYRGSLIGLAVGDCLGAPVEFEAPGSFPPVTEPRAGGTHRLAVGEWTDDTSLALCLAESLVDKGGFDPTDQLGRYRRWYREGHLSSVGKCFDIGNATRQAIEAFERTGAAFCGRPDAAGNGSLMRLAPVALAFAHDPKRAIHLAGESSRTTHAAPEAVDACRYFAALLLGALQGVTKEALLEPRWAPVPGLWDREPLCPAVAEVASGSYKRDAPPRFRTSNGGFVVDSLAAALWAFWSTETFAEGALAAVNLGLDADTYGAIYGQLAGAYYGLKAIPEKWREPIVKAELINGLADRLAAMAR